MFKLDRAVGELDPWNLFLIASIYDSNGTIPLWFKLYHWTAEYWRPSWIIIIMADWSYAIDPQIGLYIKRICNVQFKNIAL